MEINTSNDDFFRRIGSLLGHLQWRIYNWEVVSVAYDEKQKRIHFVLKSDRIYTYSLDAPSFTVTSYSLTVIADAIIHSWRELQDDCMGN